MATTPSWWEQLGDQIGLPGVAAAGYGATKAVPSVLSTLARYGLGVGGSLAAAPLTAGLTAASVMSPQPTNTGEVPFYIRNAQGQMVPNPAAQPTLFNPGAAPQAPASAPTPAPAPSPAPSAAAAQGQPPAGVPLPQARPQMAPPQPTPMNILPQTQAAAAQGDFYNGPGSLNYSPFSASQNNSGGSNSANGKALIQKFMTAMQGGMAPFGQPQQQSQQASAFAPQQQQGLLPKLFGDIGSLQSFFGGGGASSGDSTSNPTLLGSLY